LLDFGSVYSTDLFAKINLPLPGSAAKDIVLTPGDSIIAKPIIYVKDYPTGDIYKLTIDTTDAEISEIIQTYAFKMGMAQGRFSYATAVDLIQSIISITLVVISNFIAKKFSDDSLF
jgi:hypothetical protein